jgi:hypothetical protein
MEGIALPALVVSPHPLLPQAAREIHYAPFAEGETVEDYLRKIGFRPGARDWLLAVDGCPVPRAYWSRIRPKPGTLVTLRALVHGGGDDGGKNPLATVASLAVMVFAPELGLGLASGLMGGEVAATTFLWGSSITGAMIGSAAISIGANLLIGSMVSPPPPNISKANGIGVEAAVSPTYALTGGQNRARPFEPLPLLMGKHRIFPDLGAKPFTEFIGDEQYLYVTLNFGLSRMDLTSWNVGDTPVANYRGVKFYMAGDDGKVADFPSNVDTITGGTLTQAVSWLTRTGSVDTTMLGIDLQGMLYSADENGLKSASATIEAQYRAVGAGTWLAFFPTATLYHTSYWSKGYYTVNGAGATVWIQVGYSTAVAGDHTEGASAGTLYDAPYVAAPIALIWHWRPYAEILNPDGKTLREPAPRREYDTGAVSITHISETRKPIRSSYKRHVEPGQYEVRVRKTSADVTGPADVCEFTWSALKSYQTDTADYTGQRRVGVRILASGQLNGTLDQLNAVGEGYAAVWDSAHAQWGIEKTRNPAWWYLFFARGKKHPTTGQTMFGCGFDDARIDVEGIKAWATFCDAKGLTFDGVFDQGKSRIAVLDAIALCGRGSPSWGTGKIGVVWEDSSAPTVAVFGMGNILSGSYEVEYAADKLADEVILVYRNAAKNFAQDSVRVTVPGYPPGYLPTRPQQVELFGCTEEIMAGKAANLLAASQRYHRRRITWQTDAEGLVAQRGDVVAVSHDLSQWGYSGRLVAASATQLTFDRAVSYSSGTPYVLIRKPNGTTETRAVQAFAGEAETVTLASPLSFDPGADPDFPVFDYTYLFDPTATPGHKVRIVGVPKIGAGGKTLQFVAMDEVAAYHAAESGTYIAPTAVVTQPLPKISGLMATDEWTLVGNSYANKIILTWTVEGAFAKASVMYGINGEPQTLAGTTEAMRFEFMAPDRGTVDVTVALLDGLGRMDAVDGVATLNIAIGAKNWPISSVLFLTVQDAEGMALCRWPQVADPDFAGCELRFNPPGNENWDDGTTITKTTRGTQVTTAIVPPGTWTFMIKAHDAIGNVSEFAATATATIHNPNTVIFQRDEPLVWELGTPTHAVIHQPTRSLVAQSQGTAQANGWATFDVAVPNPYTDAGYESPEIDLGSDGRARVYAVLLSHLAPQAAGVADPETYCDTRTEAGAYAGFQPWDMGFAACRRIKFKFLFDSADGVAIVTAFTPTVDVKPRTETAVAAIDAAGTAVVFANRYFLPPVVTVGPADGAAGGAAASAVTATGFQGNRYNSSGTGIAGTLSYAATGV